METRRKPDLDSAQRARLQAAVRSLCERRGPHLLWTHRRDGKVRVGRAEFTVRRLLAGINDPVITVVKSCDEPLCVGCYTLRTRRLVAAHARKFFNHTGGRKPILNRDQVNEIRGLHGQGWGLWRLAKRFGTDTSMIFRVVRNVGYWHDENYVPPPRKPALGEPGFVPFKRHRSASTVPVRSETAISEPGDP